MTPLNRAERTNAFWSFLLLFLVTIGVVLTVVFFSIKVQFRENERLRNKMLMIQNEKNLSDSFRTAMNVVLNEMTNYDLKKDQPGVIIKQNVDLKIERLGKLIKNMPERSNEEKSIYELVIQNLADLNKYRQKIRSLEEGKN